MISRQDQAFIAARLKVLRESKEALGATTLTYTGDIPEGVRDEVLEVIEDMRDEFAGRMAGIILDLKDGTDEAILDRIKGAL